MKINSQTGTTFKVNHPVLKEVKVVVTLPHPKVLLKKK